MQFFGVGNVTNCMVSVGGSIRRPNSATVIVTWESGRGNRNVLSLYRRYFRDVCYAAGAYSGFPAYDVSIRLAHIAMLEMTNGW